VVLAALAQVLLCGDREEDRGAGAEVVLAALAQVRNFGHYFIYMLRELRWFSRLWRKFPRQRWPL
jgi:hypothetical protein